MFLIFVFVFVFTSCVDEPSTNYRAKKRANSKQYEAVLMFHLYKSIEKYKDILALLEEKKGLYDEISEMYYDINVIHNEIAKKQKSRSRILVKLQDQIVNLEGLIASVDWPKEIHEKLQALKEDIKSVQKTLIKTDSSKKEGEITIDKGSDKQISIETVTPVEKAVPAEGTAKDQPEAEKAVPAKEQAEEPPEAESVDISIEIVTPVEKAVPAEGTAKDQPEAEKAVPAEEQAEEPPEAEKVVPAEEQAEEPPEAEKVVPAEEQAEEPPEAEKVVPAEEQAEEPPEAEKVVLAEEQAEEPPEAEKVVPAEEQAEEPPEAEKAVPAEEQAEEPPEAEKAVPAEGTAKDQPEVKVEGSTEIAPVDKKQDIAESPKK